MVWPRLGLLGLLVWINTCRGQSNDSTASVLPAVVIEDQLPGMHRLQPFQNRWQIDSLNRFWGGTEDAAQLLQRMPGVYIIDYGGHGGLRTVGLRGLANNATQVELDGIWIPELQTGVFDLNGWLLDGLESVDVSNTGGAGAGGSSGAWINFSSSLPKRQIRMGAGSFGERTWGIGERLDWGNCSLGLQYRFLTAHDRFPYSWNEVKDRRQNADYHLNQFGLSFRRSPGINQILSYRLMGFNRQQGVPGPVVKGNAGHATERLRQNQHLMYLKWQGCHSRMGWTLAASHRSNRMQLIDNPSKDNYDLSSYGIQADVGHAGNRWRWELGLRSHWTELEGNRLGISFQPVSRVSRTEFHLGSAVSWYSLLDTLSTIEHRRITLRVGSSAVSAYQPEHQFSIQAQHVLIPRYPVWVFAEGLRGVRYPSFNELYYFAFGNAGLNVERIWSGQFGLLWYLGRESFSSIRVSAFANRTENKILSIPITPVRWTTLSLGRTQAQGVEMASTVALGKWLRFFTSTNWMLARDFSLTQGADLPYFPRWLTQGGVEIHFMKCWLSVSTQYTGTRYSSLIRDDFYRLNAFTLVDLSLGRTIRIGSGELLIVETGVQNLLSQNYVLIQSFPMPGRTFWIRFKWLPARTS